MTSGKQGADRTLMRWAVALERFPEIRWLVENTAVTADDVEGLAERLKIDRATVYRLVRKYRKMNTVEGLLAAPAGWRSGRSRISADVAQVVENAIRTYYLTSQSPSVAAVHRQIAGECKATSLTVPARSTVARYIAGISRKRSAGSRGGRSKAEAQTMRPGALIVAAPNNQWQIDHSPADIIVVDVATRKPIGRPWLTFVIDVCTRAVVGLHISLDAPSVISVGMALRHAILDKSEGLRAGGIEGEWPGFGLPDTIQTDNGSDFRGQAFAHACANLGIELKFRPIGAARYGGHIERLIGTAQREMHLLPGTTFSNIADRGCYDSDAKASMTLDELEVWLWRFIACDYNRRLHSSLDRAPLDVWTSWLDGGGPRQPSNAERLAFDFLPFVSRSITRQGIVLNKVQYFEPFLESLFDSGNRRLMVRYDPRDLSRIYFKSDDGIQTVRYRNLAQPPMSLWELKAAQRRLVAEGRSLISEEDIFDARERNKVLVAESKSKTRRHRLQVERATRGYAAAEKISPPSDPVQADLNIENATPITRTMSHNVGEIETW